MRVASWTSGLLVAVIACEAVTAPALPEGTQPMDPLVVYQRWWEMTQACSGRTGDFSRLSWYVIPGVKKFSIGALRDVAGAYVGDGRIVLAGMAVRDGHLVRHEMLHALLRESAHPRAEFIGKCGGVVVCIAECFDAELPPSANPLADTVDPSALRIAVEVEPQSPGSDVLEGYFALTITARNPSSQPVIVRLPPSGDSGPSASFRYRMIRQTYEAWYDDRAWAEEVTRFEPGETKRRIFEFWVGRADVYHPLQPGDMECQGAFGPNWAEIPVPVTVRP